MYDIIPLIHITFKQIFQYLYFNSSLLVKSGFISDYF